MRIYQSTDGSYIATDDAGIKERGATEDEARAAYLAAGGKDDPPPERPERRPRQ